MRLFGYFSMSWLIVLIGVQLPLKSLQPLGHLNSQLLQLTLRLVVPLPLLAFEVSQPLQDPGWLPRGFTYFNKYVCYVTLQILEALAMVCGDGLVPLGFPF